MTKKEIAEVLNNQYNRAINELQRIGEMKIKHTEIYKQNKCGFDADEKYYDGWMMAIYQVAVDLGVEDIL